MYLFFDTETTGLPKDWKAPLTDFDNWPRLVQLAWAAYTPEGGLIARRAYIVAPDGFEIPKEASAIHGITTERAKRDGRPIAAVLGAFHYQLKNAKVVIGHNIGFDNKIAGAEILRLKLPKITPPRKKICTMLSSTKYCGLPSERGGFKWPKLVELHRKLFGSDFEGAHNANFDVAATVKCFWELKRLGIIEI